MDDIRASFRQNCSAIPRAILRVFMISLHDNESFLYKTFALFILALSFTYPVNNLWFFMYYADNFDVKCNTASHILGGLLTPLKVLLILSNRKRLNNVINRIVELQKTTNTEEWSQTFVYKVNCMIMGFTAVMASGLSMFAAQCLIVRMTNNDPKKWSLPFSDVAFIDRSYSPNYEIALLYQTTCITFMGNPFFLTDFLIMGLIADLIIQVKLIRERILLTIEEGANLSKNQEDRADSWFFLQKALKKIVVDHISLFDLILDIEKVSNRFLLANVLGYFGVMCLLVYYASVLPMISIKSFQIYLEILGVVICLFITCYCGTQLSESGQSVGTACYESRFWETDVRFQKGILLIMLRSQRPMTVTVGKFVVLSINVFVWIMKNSYTLSLILNKSNEGIEGQN